MRIQLIFLFLFINGNLLAQNIFEGISFGTGAATVVNPQNGDSKTALPCFATSLGVFAYAHIHKDFFLKPGIAISKRGTNGYREYIAYDMDRGKSKYSYANYYIDVPIIFTYHHSYRYIYFVGGYFSRMLKSIEKVDDWELSNGSHANMYDYGVTVGVTRRITKRLKIGLNTQIGFANTRKKEYYIYDNSNAGTGGIISQTTYRSPIKSPFYGKNVTALLFLEWDFIPKKKEN